MVSVVCTVCVLQQDDADSGARGHQVLQGDDGKPESAEDWRKPHVWKVQSYVWVFLAWMRK